MQYVQPSAHIAISIPVAGSSKEPLHLYKQHLNLFVSVGGGEGVGVSATLSWPEAGPGPTNVQSSEPCGVGVSIGICGGIPVTFMVGNPYIWKNTYPPPAYR
jgi:hypothetical protein